MLVCVRCVAAEAAEAAVAVGSQPNNNNTTQIERREKESSNRLPPHATCDRQPLIPTDQSIRRPTQNTNALHTDTTHHTTPHTTHRVSE